MEVWPPNRRSKHPPPFLGTRFAGLSVLVLAEPVVHPVGAQIPYGAIVADGETGRLLRASRLYVTDAVAAYGLADASPEPSEEVCLGQLVVAVARTCPSLSATTPTFGKKPP
jgi:hypothetical protein